MYTIRETDQAIYPICFATIEIPSVFSFFFFKDTATPEIPPLPPPDPLPIPPAHAQSGQPLFLAKCTRDPHQRVFEPPLHACGAVRKPPSLRGRQIDGFVRAARRAEQVDKPR